jgi:ketosteroid isomerase-like protein
MLKLGLPAAITEYVNAANIQDVDAIARCFVDDAFELTGQTIQRLEVMP